MKTTISKLTLKVSLPVFIAFLVFIMSAGSVQAQQKNLIGVETSLFYFKGMGLNPLAGFSYERKFTDHSSIVTGLHHYSYKAGFNFKTGEVNNWKRYHYLSLPILYKYSSNIVNISAGPTINFFAGAKSSLQIIFQHQN